MVATISQQTPPVSAPDGTSALELSITTGPSTASFSNVSASYLDNAVSPGEVYTLSCETLAGATGRGTSIGFSFYTSAGGLISSQSTSTASNNTSTWTTISTTTGAAPANAAYIKMTAGISEAGVTAEKHYFDKMSILKGDVTGGCCRP